MGERQEALEEAARIAEQTVVEPIFDEETDHNGIYTGNVSLVQKTFLKWRDGPAIAAAIRALLQPPKATR